MAACRQTVARITVEARIEEVHRPGGHRILLSADLAVYRLLLLLHLIVREERLLDDLPEHVETLGEPISEKLKRVAKVVRSEAEADAGSENFYATRDLRGIERRRTFQARLEHQIR